MTSQLYVVSNRVDKVGRMGKELGELAESAIWIVPKSLVVDYQEAGAPNVIGVNGGLQVSRNFALDHAFEWGWGCVQMPDDFTGLKHMDGTPHSVAWAIAEMEGALDESSLMMAGVATTNNPFYAKDRINYRAFICIDLALIRPNPLRFDENMRLKEDYEYTAQHLATYGGVARCDYILPNFGHKTTGGVSDIRNSETEQEAIAYLMDKWPGMFRRNSRRENEVLMVQRGRVR